MNPRILWIEDDYYSVMGLMRPMELAGFRVDVATSAVEGHTKAGAWKSYDLMIIDLILPISNEEGTIPDEVEVWRNEVYVGVGLVKWLKSKVGATCPIIILSVVDDPTTTSGLADVKIDGILLKRGLLPSHVKEEVFRVLGLKNEPAS